ncbi:MAG: dephospho-CoA kinase [Ruminococcaceae bacterium]|nr:dephospho-CoA kinase [Oscillospiraceae bacterium]
MLIVGVTGGTGSGKSTICAYFKEKGAKIIDADIIARDIVKEGKPALFEIKEAFGSDILFSDGSLDRKKLGKIVFASSEKLNILNGITHKYIIKEIKDRVFSSSEEMVVIDAALLFETELFKLCDKTIAVTAPENERKKRIIKRDSLDVQTAKNRISSQKENSFYEEHSDYVIVNDGDLDGLKFKAGRVLKELM